MLNTRVCTCVMIALSPVQGFLSAMGVLSKVSMLLFTTCFMQIPFREHLLVQGIQVTLLAAQTSVPDLSVLLPLHIDFGICRDHMPLAG